MEGRGTSIDDGRMCRKTIVAGWLAKRNEMVKYRDIRQSGSDVIQLDEQSLMIIPGKKGG